MANNVLAPYVFVDAGSLAADYASPVLTFDLQDNIGIQLIWTGTPTGTFYPQVSLDQVNWSTLPLLPAAISAAGAADSAYMDLTLMSGCYFRVIFTRTSGTGSLTAYATGKGV